MLAALKKYNNHEDGFTLIELLIVVLIIGILAAIAIPVYLGIQNQAHKTAVKADTNQAVKAVQVAITEGATTSSQYGSKNGSDKGSTITVKASTTSGATANDFMVTTSETTTGGAINYTYQYDSVTGQFSDSDTNVALGGSNTTAPLITSAKPTSTGTVGTAYAYTVVGQGTPAPTFTATGLPTGLAISTAGVITGTPTTSGAYNYTITATNGTSPDATQSGTITIADFTPIVTTIYPVNGNTTGWSTSPNTYTITYGYNSTAGYNYNTAGAMAASNALGYTFTNLAAGHQYTIEILGGCSNTGRLYVGTTPIATSVGTADNTYYTSSYTPYTINTTTAFIGLGANASTASRCQIAQIKLTQLN